MLSEKKNLLGRLLATSALVAASLAYGVWQDQAQKLPLIAAPPPRRAPPKPVAENPPPQPPDVTVTPLPPIPGANGAPQTSPQFAVAPQPEKPAPEKPAPAAPQEQPQVAPAEPTPPPAPAEPAPQAPPAPASGPVVAMPPGTHLEDGDYISEEENFEWGVVQVKLSLHAGAITHVDILQIPDHRARSIELSEVCAPILIRETIQNQTARVDTVTEATYTSMAYQDAVASALMKATK